MMVVMVINLTVVMAVVINLANSMAENLAMFAIMVKMATAMAMAKAEVVVTMATAVVTMVMVVHLVVLVAEAASMAEVMLVAEVKTAFVAVAMVTDQTVSMVVLTAPAMFDPKSVAIERLVDSPRLITVPNSVPMMLKPVISLTPTVTAIIAILPFFFISSLTSVFAYGAILSDYSDTS